MADAVSAVGQQHGNWTKTVGAASAAVRVLFRTILPHQLIKHHAGGHANVERIRAAGHGETDQGVAGVQRFLREPFALVADEDGHRVVARQVGPESLRGWREADQEHAVSGCPAAELAMRGAGELEMKNSAHAGSHDGGTKWIAFIGDENDSANAGGLGRAQDRAKVAGGAKMFDDQPAKAAMWVAVVQRPPVLFDDCADTGSLGGDGDAAKLFGKEASLMNAARDELADHRGDQMAFEQDRADDQRFKFKPRFEGLDELANAFDPEVI